VAEQLLKSDGYILAFTLLGMSGKVSCSLFVTSDGLLNKQIKSTTH